MVIQGTAQHVPEVSDLLQRFAFVPNWRVDDVMISYAARGGSVGAHIDSYDVFLLQGTGQREWSIEAQPIATAEEEFSRLVPDINVRVLEDFNAARSWVLSPGDMLYLPPRWAHHGVSLDDECTTISIGFRAPSHRDLITFFMDAVASQRVPQTAMYEDPDLTIQDPDLTIQANPGQIQRGAIDRAREAVRSAVVTALNDEHFFADWFGAYVTKSRRDHTGYPVPLEPDEISTVYDSPSAVVDAMKRAAKSAADGGPFLYRSEGLAFAYVEHEGEKGATLFIDGHSFHLGPGMVFAAELLCQGPRLSPRDMGHHLTGAHAGDLAHLLQQLLLGGYLYAADD
ncbi:cupin superfamily protein [Tribonema minus]|uniref:Bifunctional lysine-specific demethylase and histidyl-hydroxylase n=1 Tax=Tribonema minus TaxID=303371 RepID=A0A836CPF2_9STRA|nr:cupin superfamily protein [Tribonema minus]